MVSYEAKYCFQGREWKYYMHLIHSLSGNSDPVYYIMQPVYNSK